MGNRRWVITRMHGDGTETPLHWDAPVFNEEITVRLSGSALLRGSVPVSQLIEAYDGLDQYLPYSTAIYALEEGDVLAGGIITDLTSGKGVATFIADGFSAYPDKQPYTGSYSVIQVDAATIYRALWSGLQKERGANIGVSVIGVEKSGLLLGEPKIPAYFEAQIGGKWYKKSDPKIKQQVQPNVWGRLSQNVTKTSNNIWITDEKQGNWLNRDFPFDIRIGSEVVTVTGRRGGNPRNLNITNRGKGSSRVTKHYKNTIVRGAGTKTRKVSEVKAKPWMANWYSTPDTGREMERLIADSGLEYLEEIRRNGDQFSKVIRLGKPIGRRRGGLRFVVGENVIVAPQVVFDSDRWASDVLVLGAGEGRSMKHSTAARNHRRLRKVHLATDKGATNTVQTSALARRELAFRSGVAGVEELVVRNGTHAPFGSFLPGDEIYVRTDSDAGNLSMWVRILSITYHTEEDKATLSVMRV